MKNNVMSVQQFRELMSKGVYIEFGSDILQAMGVFAKEAVKITMEINTKYHTPAKIRKLFEKLTASKIDESCMFIPPFYTECGKNIKFGKNVFINSCCRFQDNGGIEIGDNTMIGHNVSVITLNHDIRPDKRLNSIPSPVKIGKNVWIGSDCTILPGVTICDNAIIGAGSVVTKSVDKNCIVAGNPAKIIRYIEDKEFNNQ